MYKIDEGMGTRAYDTPLKELCFAEENDYYTKYAIMIPEQILMKVFLLLNPLLFLL